METENNQEIVEDLEASASVDDTSDTAESDQNTGEDVHDEQPKQPKIWQVVRGIQKTLDELQRTKSTPQPKEQVKSQSSELSSMDVIALAKADIADDDIPEVLEYAKFKKMPIAKALQDSVVKSMLSVKAEQRKTAEATNTSGSRRTSQKITGEVLLERASKGDMPTTEQGINDLVAARIESMRKK